MWPEIKQVLLQTAKTYEEYRQSHANIARNICIAAIVVAGIFAMFVFLGSYFLKANVSIDTLENASWVFFVNQSVAAGQDVSLLAAGLVAILLYKSSKPHNGISFTTSIPPTAWRLFVLTGIAVVVLYAVYHKLSELNAEAYDNQEQLKSQLYEWSQQVVSFSIIIITTCMTIFIYLRGIGQPYDPGRRLAFFASALLLFCWVRGMVEINNALSELVLKFMLIIFPTALVDLLVGNAISFAVSIFTILPAATIVSSAYTLETDIQLNECSNT